MNHQKITYFCHYVPWTKILDDMNKFKVYLLVGGGGGTDLGGWSGGGRPFLLGIVSIGGGGGGGKSNFFGFLFFCLFRLV